MKKFTKICLLTSLILILVGGTVCVVGGISGGWKMVKEIENDNGESVKQIVQKYGDGIRINAWFDEWDEDIETELDELEERTESALEGKGKVQELDDIDIDEIEDLEISIGGAALYMCEATDGELSFRVDGKKKYRCYESGGTLYVEGGKNINNISGEEKVYLYLPAGIKFEDVKVHVGGGVIEMKNLNADEIEFAIGAGEIRAEGITGNSLLLEVGAGSTRISDVNVGKLDAEVGIGDCNVQGTITKEIEVECGMGNVALTLAGKEEDYNYDISCAAGMIQLGDESYSGLASDKYIDNDAKAECNLECAMGNIEVKYK